MTTQTFGLGQVISTSSSWVLKTLGLGAVAVLIYMACQNKITELRTNLQAMPAGYASAQDKFKQLECLTRNIYWEAATEPFEGKVAVAQVTINRLNDGRFGDSICTVVHQRSVIYQRVVCQFTWTCENNHKIRPVHPGAWQESEVVAKKVYLENFRLPSLDTALYYHADYVNPGWQKPKIIKTGRHIFYSEGRRT